MGIAAWVVLLLIGMAVVQVLAFHFLRDRMETSPGNGWAARTALIPMPAGDDRPREGADECRCPACGAVNDRDYVFCRTCVSRLGV